MTTGSAGFEPRRLVGSFLAITWGVLLSPARFFAGVGGRGALSGPVIYAIVCAAIFIFLAQASRLAVVTMQGDLSEVSALGATGLGGAIRFIVLLLVLSPLLALAILYAAAAFYQLLVRVVVGRENGGYQATVRVVAYLSAIQLLMWIPFLGLVVGLWGLWVNTVGLKEVHYTTTARAALVAGIPFVLSAAWTIVVVAGPATLQEILLSTGGFFPGA